jgi:hypothetical protein
VASTPARKASTGRATSRSCPNKATFGEPLARWSTRAKATPWIRLGLRGARRLGALTHLSCRYRLTGADSLQVALVDSASKRSVATEVRGSDKDRWAQTVAEFAAASSGLEQADEVHFRLPKGAVLLLDDVLLYEPGR